MRVPNICFQFLATFRVSRSCCCARLFFFEQTVLDIELYTFRSLSSRIHQLGRESIECFVFFYLGPQQPVICRQEDAEFDRVYFVRDGGRLLFVGRSGPARLGLANPHRPMPSPLLE